MAKLRRIRRSLLLAAAALPCLVIAEELLPDEDFLEYLGSWEESDEDWLAVLDELDEEKASAKAEADEAQPPAEQEIDESEEKESGEDYEA